ncbi:MAG: LacI family DNA-binding transcriptional regulator [Armatimonadota bacterium]
MSEDANNDSTREVTMREVAERCGVSIVTVSRAMRNAPRISPLTRQRILAVAEELGYDPAVHHTARRLVMRKVDRDILNQTVGLIFPHSFLNANYYSTIFRGIVKVLTLDGYALVTIPSYSSQHDHLETLPPIFHRGEIDGVIITASSPYLHLMIDRFHAIKRLQTKPIVTLLTPAPNVSSVMVDEQAGAYTLVDHLLALGHRHLLYFTPGDGITYYFQQQRIAGYRRACADHQVDPDACLHTYEYTGSLALQDGTFLPLMTLLEQHPEITAILAPNDLQAVRLYDALLQRGYRVPDDISLVGFDDTDPVLDQRRQNILTTVRLPLEELGRYAARCLLDRITGRLTSDVQMTLPVSLIVRESTAPPTRKA